MSKLITLAQFLKLRCLVGSGGEAKIRIQEGEIRVNGEVETRRGRKLSEGDVVEFAGKREGIGQDSYTRALKYKNISNIHIDSIKKLSEYSEKFEAGQTGILLINGPQDRLKPAAKDFGSSHLSGVNIVPTSAAVCVKVFPTVSKAFLKE